MFKICKHGVYKLWHSGKKDRYGNTRYKYFFIILRVVHVCDCPMGGVLCVLNGGALCGKGVLQIRNMFYMSTQGKSVTVLRGKIWGVEAELVVRHLVIGVRWTLADTGQTNLNNF